MRKIKLIWDFRGPEAERTAKHHLIHLKEFIEREDLAVEITGVDELNPQHFIAFIVVTEPDMPGIRDILKPHRGQFVKQE